VIDFLCRLPTFLCKAPFPSKKPRYVGHWTNDVVYSRLAPGIKEELASLTPKTQRGNRRNKFHQWLTDDIGHPKLQEHLASVIALMKASDDWQQFHKMLDRSLPSYEEIASRPLFKNLEYEDD
jgi:P63C domain